MKKTVLLFLIMLAGICFGQAQLGQAIELVNIEKFDEANSIIDAFLKDHGNDHRANYIKALILTNKKDYNKAVEYIEKAISLQSDKGDYYQLAGQLYEELDETKLAVGAWKKCQKHAKDNKLFVEAKNHLDYLTKE